MNRTTIFPAVTPIAAPSAAGGITVPATSAVGDVLVSPAVGSARGPLISEFRSTGPPGAIALRRTIGGGAA